MPITPELTTAEKNAAIACLERKLQDAYTASGTASLSEIEAAVAGVRIAFDVDPETVSDADVAEIITQVQAIALLTPEDTSAVIAGFIEGLTP